MLESLGLSRTLANSALRVSFSAMNTKEDVDRLIEALVRGVRPPARYFVKVVSAVALVFCWGLT